MSLALYKVIHVLGVLLLFLGLGACAAAAANARDGDAGPGGKLVMFHGIGLLIILVGGFGMLAKLGIGTAEGPEGLGWVMAKLVIWVIMGASILLPRRKPEMIWPWTVTVAVLGTLSAYFAIYKPF